MKNIEAAKELLEKYKNITLEQLEEAYKKTPYSIGGRIMHKITGFGKINSCILCQAISDDCTKCIYSFRDDDDYNPCIDEIYREMDEAKNAKELFIAIQKRISYLTHIIDWYETRR